MKEVNITKHLIVASLLAFREKNFEAASEHMSDAVSQPDFDDVASEILDEQVEAEEEGKVEISSIERAVARRSMEEVARTSIKARKASPDLKKGKVIEEAD